MIINNTITFQNCSQNENKAQKEAEMESPTMFSWQSVSHSLQTAGKIRLLEQGPRFVMHVRGGGRTAFIQGIKGEK